MTYDPKNRPVFLGNEQDRSNPNRLTAGVVQVADQNNTVTPIPQPPSLIEKIMHGSKILALILASLAGTVAAIAAQGVALPGWLTAAAGVVTAIAAALGIASGGIKAPASDAGAGALKDLPPEK